MKKWIGLVLMAVALFFILSNLNRNKNNHNDNTILAPVEPRYEYGILVDTFNVIKGVVSKGQTFGEILYANHIDHPKISEIVEKSKEVFDFRRVQVNKKYMVMCTKDSLKKHVILFTKKILLIILLLI